MKTILLDNASTNLFYQNGNNKNIRSLVEKNLEIINFKFFLMETEVCVGTPEQCFTVLYDTGSTYLILGMESDNLKFKKGFNALKSETFNNAYDRIFTIPYKTSVIMAREVKDKVTIIKNRPIPYLFSFALSWNSTEFYDFDGILGLGNYYPKIDKENSFDERFSFVHNLKLNGIIDKLIFGHEYTDRTHGNIYFGEEPKSMLNGYFKCKVENFISYVNKWHCQLLSMYFSEEENYIPLSSIAAFDTGYPFIRGPFPQVFDILNKIKEIGGEKCKYIYQDNEENNRLAAVICDLDINISDFPDISFNIVGFKMTLLKRDLFKQISINEGEIKYGCILIADSYFTYWNFGEPILKNYDMVFNYEDNTVGFKVNNNYLNGNWTHIIILLIIFTLLVAVAIYIIKNRKTIFKKNIKEEDIKKLESGNELKEGLQMQDL